MKPTTTVNKLPRHLSYIVTIILVLVPFHALITIWLASAVGHYTLLRLWKEFLLVPIILGALYILWKDKLARRFFGLEITRLILVYAILLIICAVVALYHHTVFAKAMWYGLLVDLRFLIFFLAVLIIAARSSWLTINWRKILLIPAILVAAFAILQYLVLPYDFLKHFDYNDSTISPYETINHNLQHIRVMSTLRGANPLGAYLIVPISALAVLMFKEKKEQTDKLVIFAGLLLALVFSFSRSAWIGAFLSISAAAGLSIKSAQAKKRAAWGVMIIVVASVILAMSLRNNLSFENFIFHTDRTSKIAVSSNEGHAAAFRSAIHDIVHQPLGGGVGTAGPQSVYNHRPTRIAENYFLQIGQEAGVIGMALFIAICLVIAEMLWRQRAESLALLLFVSLIGITFVNLLSHAWTDDTLAYIWWGLAGIALAPAILTDGHNRKNAKKIKPA